MQCVECRHENREEARVCDECGTPLPRPCQGCGRPNRADAKFCDECGAHLDAAPDGPADPPDDALSTAPQTYTPRYLAEKILTTRSALEGEHKLVTVLFADLADSSAMAQQLDAEKLHLLLDRVLQLAAAAVHRYAGTVNSYLGDGMMALFGAPIALEDHASRAVHAALAIQEAMRDLDAAVRHELGVPVQLRIGLNTGPVVVGRIGVDLRRDYTANSNVVHLASRLQSVAEPGTIVVTEDTRRAVAGEIATELLGPIEIRGQREPVVLFKVTGRRAQPNPLGPRGEHGLTGLVGRARELGVLHERLSRAKAGQGQAVAVVGEPGLGKSRLLYEFRQSLGDDGAGWLEGHCRAHSLSLPYGPIVEVLRFVFGIGEGDPLSRIGEKLRAGMRELDPALPAELPFLEPLFGLPGDEARLRALDRKDRRERTQRAIVDVIAAVARQRPLVLVFENLHWRDQSSEDAIAFLAGRLPGTPVLLLTTHRPGYQLRWADMPFSAQVSLDRLTDDEREEMATGLLGGRGVASELLHFIAERADGNPLFIEEVTRALVERNFLIEQPVRLRLANTAELEFPSTIQGIIQARIDALGEAVKHTVQTAAVIGAEFDADLLTAASETASAVSRHLEILQSVELVHEARLLSTVQYRFKHAVIQDVAYRSLLGPRRQTLHGAIAHCMEALGRHEQAAALAHHYAHSAEPERAVGYAITAGNQAARLYANAEASDYYDQVLALVKSLPASPDLQRAHIDAALKRAAVGTTREALEADERNLEEARELAAALGDEPRIAGVLYWLGRLAYVRGMFDRATEYAGRSLSIADRLSDEALAAPPVNLMGRVYYLTGAYDRAGSLLARNVEQMHNLGNPTEEATAAGFAGVAFGALGAFERALAYADRGLRLAQELHNPFVEAAAYNYRAVAHCFQGSAAAAIADCRAAKEIAERVGDRFRIYLVQFYEGQAWTMAGDPAKARALLEDSIALAKQLGTTTLLAWGKGLLAMSLLALGEAGGAEAQCREALRLADETHDRLAGALAHRAFAAVLARLEPGDAAAAEAAIGEAIRIHREMGCEPELGRSHLGYARLLDGWGRTEEAAQQLAKAVTIFRRLDMPADLAQAASAPAPGTSEEPR